ncbi:MAG: hypothetical protein ACRYGK_14635 [Janthinobacterium lividum]
MFEISIRSNLKEIQKKLSDFAHKQVPFATATALTSLAKRVKEAEVLNLEKVLDSPTPFTLRSIGAKGATKNNLQAEVYVKDVAAAYLLPFEFGGKHKMNGPKIMNPMDTRQNAYGNIPKGTFARLMARSDVFVGVIKFKSGRSINGVWQRPRVGLRRDGTRGTKGSVRNIKGQVSGLKLLIRLDDEKPVKQHLGYMSLARKVINAKLNKEFGVALAKAMATAK